MKGTTSTVDASSLRSAWLHPATRAGRRFLDKPYASVQLMLLSGLGLLAFGLIMATSTTISASLQAGSHQTMWSQLTKEVEFLVLGIPIFWLAVRLPPRAYRLLAYPALLIGLVALLAVLVPGVGVQINGARRWIALGPLQLQPSEFVKIAILLWGADLLARKQELRTLNKARQLFVPLVPGFVMICLLVVLEPDLGTTLCFLLILVGLLWTVGTPLRYFAALVAMLGVAVGGLAYIAPYRLERLTSFTNPFKYSQSSGLQEIQGLYALSSGGLFGQGLGGSTSKYGWLPNASTDYVFAVIGEETGLIGCLVVLLLFALFAFAGLRISRQSIDPFVRLAAGGATVWISGQAVINVGYVTGLLPVTGIPLPFISAGGTSLLATATVFGMLVSFARHEPAAVRVAQLAQASGRRGRVQRWCRIPVPRAYLAPKRGGKSTRAAAKPASRPVRASGPPVRSGHPQPRTARVVDPRAVEHRTVARAVEHRTVAGAVEHRTVGRAVGRGTDTRSGNRATGTEGPRRRQW
jgi:cell division protein FtsW